MVAGLGADNNVFQAKGNFLERVASRENDDGIVESFPRDCGKLAASGRGCVCRGWHTRPIGNNPDSRSDSERSKECYADCKNEQTERSLEGLLGVVGVGYGIRNIEERLTRADLTDAI